MKIKFVVFSIILLITSCVKIPIQSVSLIDSIKDEGKRMHTINISLLNNFFSEKQKKVDDFITKEYSPKFIGEFMKNIPSDFDIKIGLPTLILKMLPKINERRDAMQSALESNRIRLIEKMNQDYDEYETACIELKSLLQSAVNVADERKKILEKATQITKNKIDFEQLGVTMDSFITDSGDFGKNITNLNEGVNKLINK